MRFWVALFWAIVIAVLHAIPSQHFAFKQLNYLFQLDKLFHLGVFAIGAWLLVRALKQKYAKHAFRYTFIVYALYGILLEIMQDACFEGRDPDLLDWIADIAGVTLALWLNQKIYQSETIKS
tara:strand:- start:4550 stop:4915 length:366 start_codon:yes stop_codon:yes gene_type:complete